MADILQHPPRITLDCLGRALNPKNWREVAGFPDIAHGESVYATKTPHFLPEELESLKAFLESHGIDATVEEDHLYVARERKDEIIPAVDREIALRELKQKLTDKLKDANGIG